MGDGTISTSQDVTHQYTAPRVYTVCLTVTDVFGYAASWSKSIKVLDPNGDEDGDGLTNYLEVYTYYTDAYRTDTDGDELLDGEEDIIFRTSAIDSNNDGKLEYIDGTWISIDQNNDKILEGYGYGGIVGALYGSSYFPYVCTTPDGYPVHRYTEDTTVTLIFYGDCTPDGDYEPAWLYGTASCTLFGWNYSEANSAVLGPLPTDPYFTNRQERGCSPLKQETDGDGMSDDEENAYAPTLNPAVSDADLDPDIDEITNIDELHKYKTNPTLYTTYYWSDKNLKSLLDDVRGADREFLDPMPLYAKGSMENCYITEYKIKAPIVADPYGDGVFTSHVYNPSSSQFSVTLRSYDASTDNDDTGDTINPYQLKDINGNSISFTKSVSGATYTITTTSVQPAGDYELWWTYSEDGDGSTLSITATIPIVFVCPDPAVGTYPNKITFHNDVSQDIYFRGHTQWAGYLTDLKLDGTTSISTSTNSGNQLYVNSEFCYYLGSVSSGTHYIEYNWEVTGTSAEMQFFVSATGSRQFFRYS